MVLFGSLPSIFTIYTCKLGVKDVVSMRRTMKIIEYEEKYRDDLIFMILQAKDALGRKPGLNEDLLDIKKNYSEKGGGFYLLIDEKDRVIGSVGYSPMPENKAIFLHRLFIKADKKRQGLGSLLLNRIHEILKEKGKREVRIHLGSPRKEWMEAYSFYSKHGYMEYEENYMRRAL